ncbi:unnamed protein product [Ixodes persulcatus]
MAAKDAPLPGLAAASLRSPAPFSFGDAGEWLSWLQQFEDYSSATGMHVAPDETRVAWVHGHASSSVRSCPTKTRAVLSRSHPAAHKLPRAPHKRGVREPPVHKQTQQPGETVDSFFTALT